MAVGPDPRLGLLRIVRRPILTLNKGLLGNSPHI